MGAIMLILINTSVLILILLVNLSLGLNTTSTTAVVDVNQCSIDPRVATLRCIDVPVDLIQEALNEWDLSLVTRLDISGAKGLSGGKPIWTMINELRSTKLIPLKLRGLFIRNVGLQTLKDESLDGFDHNILETINLSWNELISVPEVVLKLVKLRHLDLSHNKILSLPPGSSFNNLNALASLKLSGNRLGGSSTIFHEKNSTKRLSLLDFNLEPLTDTLEALDLSDNGLTGLPMQFESRSFARLRDLDLSHNPIKDLPSSAFAGMSTLESLNLQHTQLRTIVLKEEVAHHLKLLEMEGNPLHCDCHTRWLWGLASAKDATAAPAESTDGGGGSSSLTSSNNRTDVRLPPCATPFSARGVPLVQLPAEDLCELLPGSDTRPPRFYRVSKRDEAIFPLYTFQSLNLQEPLEVSKDTIKIGWSIQTNFYYTDYDWGLVYREIGEPVIYKTRYNLKSHLEAHPEWTPQSENLTALLGGLRSDIYYEVCLAVVEHVTVYYIHQDLCQEIKTLTVTTAENLNALVTNTNVQHQNPINNYPLNYPIIRTKNVTVVPHQDSLTLTWHIDVKNNTTSAGSPDIAGGAAAAIAGDELVSVIRQISIREFGSDNATQLFVLEDFNMTHLMSSKKEAGALRYYTLPNLKSGSSYVVCFETIHTSSNENNSYQNNNNNEKEPKNSEDCHETRTLSAIKADMSSLINFPMTEVLISAAVTALVCIFLAVMCCFLVKLNKKSSSNNNNNAQTNNNSRRHSAMIQSHDQGLDENDNTTHAGVVKEHLHIKHADDVEEPMGVQMETVTIRSRSPSPNAVSMSPSMATTFEPELQSIMTDKETEEMISRDSKFRERYSTQIPKTSSSDVDPEHPTNKNLRFWKSCLSTSDDTKPKSVLKSQLHAESSVIHTGDTLKSTTSTLKKNKKAAVEEKFAETQEYLRKPNVLYPPWPSSPPTEHYHTLPSNLHHVHHPSPHHHNHHSHHHHHLSPRLYHGGPDSTGGNCCDKRSTTGMFGPGSYHTIAHYQLYKRPIHVDYCPSAPAPEHFVHRSHFMSLEPPSAVPADFVKTLGRTRRESPMATKAIGHTPVKMKKMIKAKMLLSPGLLHHHHHHHPSPITPASHLHLQEDHSAKMYTWSPYSSHMMYNELQHHHHHAHGAGKSLDELRF